MNAVQIHQQPLCVHFVVANGSMLPRQRLVVQYHISCLPPEKAGSLKCLRAPNCSPPAEEGVRGSLHLELLTTNTFGKSKQVENWIA